MHETFVAFEPEEQQQSSSQVPGLLFVTCDQQNGVIQEHVKPRLRRHVMRTHLHSNRRTKPRFEEKPEYDSTSRKVDKLQPAGLEKSARQLCSEKKISSTHRYLDTTDAYLGEPQTILDDSLGTLSLPFETEYDAKNVLKWMTTGHDSTQAERFKIAHSFYQHGLWEWASTRKLALDGLALHACRKKIELAGDSASNRREFLQRKANLVKSIQEEINKKETTTDAGTTFGIVALACCLILESDLEAISVHLIALRSICAQKHSFSICWVYVWLLDLRLALFTGNHPVLDFNLTDELKRHYSQYDAVRSVKPDALRLAFLCPKAENTFFPPRTVGLFSKVLQLCSVVESLAETVTLPFHPFYEIEYEIRNMHASALAISAVPTRTCVELVVLAIQLSVWIAGRFFAPLAENAITTVVQRMNRLLGLVSPIELLEEWRMDAQASAVSLLWVLTLSISCSAAGSDEQVSLSALAHVTNHLSVETEEEFLNELQRWPPRKTWSQSRYSTVWARLVDFKSEPSKSKVPQKERDRTIGCENHRVPRAKRPFFGVSEFWDA